MENETETGFFQKIHGFVCFDPQQREEQEKLG